MLENVQIGKLVSYSDQVKWIQWILEILTPIYFPKDKIGRHENIVSYDTRLCKQFTDGQQDKKKKKILITEHGYRKGYGHSIGSKLAKTNPGQLNNTEQ